MDEVWLSGKEASLMSFLDFKGIYEKPVDNLNHRRDV